MKKFPIVCLGGLVVGGMLLTAGCNSVNAIYKKDTGEVSEVPPPPAVRPVGNSMNPSTSEPVEFVDPTTAGANASADVDDRVIEPLPDPEPTVSPYPTPKPAPKPLRTYVIKKGDNFWNIAKNELGDPVRMKDLEDANPNIDPMKLQIGDEILLPE